MKRWVLNQLRARMTKERTTKHVLARSLSPHCMFGSVGVWCSAA